MCATESVCDFCTLDIGVFGLFGVEVNHKISTVPFSGTQWKEHAHVTEYKLLHTCIQYFYCTASRLGW